MDWGILGIASFDWEYAGEARDWKSLQLDHGLSGSKVRAALSSSRYRSATLDLWEFMAASSLRKGMPWPFSLLAIWKRP